MSIDLGADELAWVATVNLRRFDNTGKLTDPRLQQEWTCGDKREWRDVPLVWIPKRDRVWDDKRKMYVEPDGDGLSKEETSNG